MPLLCRSHAVAMPLPCRCHAVAMPLPCRCYAVAMPLLCRCHAVAMPSPCRCQPQIFKKLRTPRGPQEGSKMVPRVTKNKIPRHLAL
eukprot:9183535-Pyramimonas_sp.AAC.1